MHKIYLVNIPYTAIIVKITTHSKIVNYLIISVKELNMNQALNLNEISTLSSSLLSTLDESVFFSELTSHFQKAFGEHSVQGFKAFSDGAIQFISENGSSIIDSEIIEKATHISAYVVRTKRAYFSNNIHRDPLYATLEKSSEIISELCVPVISQGAVIGTINVRSSREDKKFGEADINLVLSTLEQLKQPIQNMKLYLMAKHLNRELLKKIELYNREIQVGSRKNEVRVIGHNSIFLGVVDMISKIAKEDFPVLFEGGNGVGKKLLAKKLHSLSGRNASEVIMVNCQNNEEELKRELIGMNSKIGLLERANGGSIIFSNIHELSSSLQNLILNILTTGKFQRQSGETVKLNIRVIATSRVDLKARVDAHEFSQDLYQRVSTIKLKVPSLSERADDIKVLASFFLNENREESEKKMLTSKAIELLTSNLWNGNVKELKSIMERAFIMTDSKYVDAQDLSLAQEKEVVEVKKVEAFSEVPLHELEKNHIIKTLEHLENNKTKAAKALGITVKTLYNKLHAYGLIDAKAM